MHYLSPSYLCMDIGCKLWVNLFTALKVKVSKTNFRAALKREWQKYTQAILCQNRNRLTQLLSSDNITLFEGLVVLGYSFYLKRCVPLAESKGLAPQPQTPIETICFDTVLKTESLIRIEGAKWMGKTSLVEHILEQGNLQAQRTVYLDFNSVERLCCMNK